MPTDSADTSNEAEQARAEMHQKLDELDHAKRAHAAGEGTIEQVQVATENAYDATERYLAAVRAVSKPEASPGVR
jgi:hypothetical protein